MSVLGNHIMMAFKICNEQRERIAKLDRRLEIAERLFTQQEWNGVGYTYIGPRSMETVNKLLEKRKDEV